MELCNSLGSPLWPGALSGGLSFDIMLYLDDLAQACGNIIALWMELSQSCALSYQLDCWEVYSCVSYAVDVDLHHAFFIISLLVEL